MHFLLVLLLVLFGSYVVSLTLYIAASYVVSLIREWRHNVKNPPLESGSVITGADVLESLVMKPIAFVLAVLVILFAAPWLLAVVITPFYFLYTLIF
ncbi:MAG: hypothetical protein ACO2ZM_06655 [Francisellaceae bacterium]